jgi:hypothetical protein
MTPPNIGENLALLNNGGNGDSVPATVPDLTTRLSVRPLIQAHVGGSKVAYDGGYSSEDTSSFGRNRRVGRVRRE